MALHEDAVLEGKKCLLLEVTDPGLDLPGSPGGVSWMPSNQTASRDDMKKAFAAFGACGYGNRFNQVRKGGVR